MHRYTDEQVAMICHDANRALQYVQGDPVPSPPWNSEPPEIRAGTIEGVRMARQGAAPREMWAAWAGMRREQGWVHGPEKDPERKIHPNLVEAYYDLPASERDKDRVFLAIVTALTAADSLHRFPRNLV